MECWKVGGWKGMVCRVEGLNDWTAGWLDGCSGVGLEGWRVGGWKGMLWRVEGLDKTAGRLDRCSGGGL